MTSIDGIGCATNEPPFLPIRRAMVGRFGALPIGQSPGALLGRVGRSGKVFLIGEDYRGKPGEEGKLTRLTIRLDRVQPDVQNGATIYYLYSKEYPSKIFSGTSALSPKLPLARAGDRASIAFLDTHEEVLPLIKFDLEEINLGAPPKAP